MKTKTETQITQDFIKEIKSLEDGDFDGQSPLKRMSDFTELKKQSLTHKATCQRFLEFLEGLRNRVIKRLKIISGLLTMKAISNLPEVEPLLHDEKITDLEQAIKLYEDAGI